MLLAPPIAPAKAKKAQTLNVRGRVHSVTSHPGVTPPDSVATSYAQTPRSWTQSATPEVTARDRYDSTSSMPWFTRLLCVVE